MEPLLYQVMRMLAEIQDYDRWGSLRQRYATKEQWKEESAFMEDNAMEKWFIVKRILVENKAQIEAELAENAKKWDVTTPAHHNVLAAYAVIQKELDIEAEKALTSQESE